MRGWRRGRQPGGGEPPGAELGDPRLVVAARGDVLAFGPHYERYRDDLLRYCFVCLGDWDDAADATQQVFANVLAKLPGFVDRDDSFRGWLFTIAHHEVGSRQRRRIRRLEEPLAADDWMEDPAPTPEDLAVCADDHRRLRALLAQLPVRRRRVCELRLADLTDRQIADILGMSESAVRTAQSRAVERLRDLMGVTTGTPTGGRDA